MIPGNHSEGSSTASEGSVSVAVLKETPLSVEYLRMTFPFSLSLSMSWNVTEIVALAGVVGVWTIARGEA